MKNERIEKIEVLLKTLQVYLKDDCFNNTDKAMFLDFAIQCLAKLKSMEL